jgi:hypothetical protein
MKAYTVKKNVLVHDSPPHPVCKRIYNKEKYRTLDKGSISRPKTDVRTEKNDI